MPSMGATTVVFERSSWSESSTASVCAMRRRWEATCASFIFSSACAWSYAWSEISFSACICLLRS